MMGRKLLNCRGAMMEPKLGLVVGLEREKAFRWDESRKGG